MVLMQFFGEILAVEQGLVIARGPNLSLGSLCWLHTGQGRRIRGVVSAVSGSRLQISPFGPVTELRVGDQFTSFGQEACVEVGRFLLGHLLDPWGVPMTIDEHCRSKLETKSSITESSASSHGREDTVVVDSEADRHSTNLVNLQSNDLNGGLPSGNMINSFIEPNLFRGLSTGSRESGLGSGIRCNLASEHFMGFNHHRGSVPLGAINSEALQKGSAESFGKSRVSIKGRGPGPLDRALVRYPLPTGIKAIDTFCTLARGQRVGIFAPAGVGKTSLLQMIINGSDADVIVVGLVGERGREVQEFLAHLRSSNKLSRTVVVASLSDDPSALRSLAAHTATAIAEYFRDQGLHVLMLIDSLTRIARALRDIAVSSGESLLKGGFPPSVYSELPLLLERAGSLKKGSISAFYTVLIPNKDEPDCLVEEVKSLVDAHIFLSEDIVREGIRPSIDILTSLSRVFHKINSVNHLSLTSRALNYLDVMRKNRLLVMMGVELNHTIFVAQEHERKIKEFLNQSIDDVIPIEESHRLFSIIMGEGAQSE